MGLMVTHARALDFLEADGVVPSPLQFLGSRRRNIVVAYAQIAGSAAITIRDDQGQLAAIAGLYDLEPGQVEAWFAVGPAIRANLKGALYRLSFAMEQAADLLPGTKATAYIDPASVAGDKLAARLGFRFEGLTTSPIGELKTWTRVF